MLKPSPAILIRALMNALLPGDGSRTDGSACARIYTEEEVENIKLFTLNTVLLEDGCACVHVELYHDIV